MITTEVPTVLVQSPSERLDGSPAQFYVSLRRQGYPPTIVAYGLTYTSASTLAAELRGALADAYRAGKGTA